MKNLSEETKKKLQNLVDTGKLLEALNFIDAENANMQILMLKGRINNLIQDKPLMTGATYHEAMNKMKKTACEIIGLKYHESELPKNTTTTDNNKKSNVLKIEQTRSRLDALSDRVKHLDESDAIKKHILTSDTTMLIARFQLLLRQKNTGTMTEEALSVELNKINMSIDRLNS